MDDPWGSSPWADETDIEVPPTPKSDPELQPTTPIRAPPLEAQAALNSPWGDDDDGFGDWADVSELPAVSGSQPKETRTTEDPWGNTTFSAPSATPRPDDFLSSWGDAPEIASDIPEDLLSPSATIVRQNSPDPWATEVPPQQQDFQASEQTNDSLVGGFDESHGGTIDVKEVQVDQNGHEASSPGLEQSASNHTETVKEEILEVADRQPDEQNLKHVLIGQSNQEQSEVNTGSKMSLEHGEIDAAPKVLSRENSLEVGTPDDPLEVSTKEVHDTPVHDVPLGLSKPSSPPPDRNHHDVCASPESSRTSLDQDHGPPVMQRKVSKVQELVQHFDGIIASQTAEPNPIMHTPPKQPPEVLDSTEDVEEVENEEDDFGDFGDFEEGFSDDNDANGAAFEDPPPNTLNLPTQGQSPHDVLPGHSTAQDHGPVTFDIDTAVLSRLYPDLPIDTVPERTFIPDTIIHDTFTSAEQRKAWHRISRFGTLRKHNTGDDENYKRVRWSKSKVRSETLEVVARWMEEDRVSGRVVLGGGNRGSSMFGWGDALKSPSPVRSSFTAQRGKNPQDRAEEASEVPREWPKMESKRSSSRTHSRKRSSSKATASPKITPLVDGLKNDLPAPRRQSSVRPVAVSEESKVEPQQSVATFGWNMPLKEPYGKTSKPHMAESESPPKTEPPNFGWNMPSKDLYGKAPKLPVIEPKSTLDAERLNSNLPSAPESEVPNFGWSLPPKDAYGTKRKSSIPKVTQEVKVESQQPEPNFGWKMPPKDPYGRSPSLSRSGSERKVIPSKAIEAPRRSTSSGRSASIIAESSNSNSPTRFSPAPPAVNTRVVAGYKPAQPLMEVLQPLSVLHPPTSAAASKRLTALAAHNSMDSNGANDDDDEWGEMVASPVVAAGPSFPSPKSPHQREPMSLNAFSAAIPLSPVIGSPPPRPSSNQGHKHAPNLGNVLKPDLRSPLEPHQTYINSQSLDSATPEISTHSSLQHPPILDAASLVNDPWASADLSFFDSASTLAPSDLIVAPPPKSSPTPQKPVSFTGNAIEMVPAPIKGRTPPQSHKSREEVAQEKIVRGIVDNLPDLSYMLR